MNPPRIFVTCYPQPGHLHPLIPIARALADAGCAIVVATAADQHDGLRDMGVDVAEVGPSHEENNRRVAEIMPQLRAAPTSQRRAIAFSFAFGKQYAPSVADDLFALARSWRADAVLAGLESLAGPLVAARLALPLIVSGFGIGLSFARTRRRRRWKSRSRAHSPIPRCAARRQPSPARSRPCRPRPQRPTASSRG